MHNILSKYYNKQIFQYSKKYKNLKEQRKIQRRSWNEKRYAENDKISGEKHTTCYDKSIKMQWSAAS
jgi:inorganic pyrophosphatase